MDTDTPNTPADLCCNPHPIYVYICRRAVKLICRIFDLARRGLCLPKGSNGKLLVVLFDGTFSAR